MSAGLIRHLKKKTDEDSNTEILMAQWRFDERLVGKSLENVGSYYPHFSSHNESHSQQILVNIERLLGDNIDKLSATDTWLILEAAYWHDIGMLFSADEVQEVFKNDKFKDYVEELANNNVQDLHEFAKVWHSKGWQEALAYYDNPYEGVEKYRQMVAEWYRRDHSDNSSRVVLEPFKKLNINSPRTELLPKRIYRYLAQICLSHGSSFTDVMTKLPFRQTGMGTENCHPRFVACLLRLGDLFDIDDNRFCPVMARQVSNTPSLSHTHDLKHQAIREFQLDNETVSVTAICSTEMAYIECRRWFDWIREEIQNQMSQWKNIVPSRDFGLLPTINKLDVEMTNSKILLNDKPMKFSLDEKSAIELLQGNNLYEDDMSIYRELIQNAIDATMIRVWLEHGQEHSQEKLSNNANPYDKHTRNLFKKYPITLDCRKVNSNSNTLWEFSIKDNGMGISKKDLEYMQKIAGSKGNKEKRKIVQGMPEWMRPAGEFGIGLHSAFLLMRNLPIEYQKIIIFTKSRLTHESLKIELNSPLSGKAGYCFIEEIKDLPHYGTTLTVFEKFEIDKKEQYIDTEISFINLFFNFNYESSYKPFKRLVNITNKITNPTINFRLKKPIYESIKYLDIIFINLPKNYATFWDDKNNIAIQLMFYNKDLDYENTQLETMKLVDNINTLYRGQLVEFDELDLDCEFFNLRNLGVNIDIYNSNSSNILSLNREEITNDLYINSLISEATNNFISNIEENEELLLYLLGSDKHKTSLIQLLAGINSSEDDYWKYYQLNSTFNIDNVLVLDGFTTLTGMNEELINILNKEGLVVIKSEILDIILENSNFINELIDEGFRQYKISSDKIRGFYYADNIFSKSDLDKDYFIEVNLEDHYSENKYLTNIDTLLTIDNDLLNDGYYSQTYKFDGIDFSFLNKETIEKITLLHFEENDELNMFIFPYETFGNMIVDIPNNIILALYEVKNENAIILDEVYTSIKKEIVEFSKENYPEWYDSYKLGINFKPINLKTFDKSPKY